ncbi:hypothetical protein PUH89_11105 [Rhodobacter capsulatus]|uniref:Uncharacterized protein n=1 Tax=Rhodobacter capsulatus TaxID=1061 RepID=A0A1G7K7H1_RHOCA|nr:hypothetical protein [Rhodobacter capsulatus]WER07888.1 hypothetical protein PUH89_11105 [Rhodobacter capsulatus]SDF33125.1 hypothetical protein SAMN04244550_02080 [Rhodobacter capsulatus]
MTNQRTFLSANPMTFNELLDLFESFLASSYDIITTALDELHDDLGVPRTVTTGRIFGVACVGGDMLRRLHQIRAERNAGSDVTITLTKHEAWQLENALGEIDRMFSAAASVFEHLHDRAAADEENMDKAGRAVMALAQRALMDSDEKEGSQLRRFSNRLKTATCNQNTAQEKVA